MKRKTFLQILIRYWIDILNPKYNICPNAGGGRGLKHTVSQIEANRIRNIGNTNKKGIKVAQHKIINMSGEKCGAHKLTALQVKEIRKKYKPKLYPQQRTEVSVRSLAKEYGVCHSQVERIINKKDWKYE